MQRIRRQLLNEDWRFRLDSLDSEDWHEIHLPHSWNALDAAALDPDFHYRRGVGEYQRRLQTRNLVEGERWWLEVEAASQCAAVYADNRRLASHAGGYTAFTVELPLDAQQLQIMIDNRPNPDVIPSDLSDFFLYGGLTRSVWSYTTGPIRIEAVWFDLETTAERAELRLRCRLSDPPAQPTRLTVQLGSPSEESLYTYTQVITEQNFAVELPSVDHPVLWSPDTPHLYTAVIKLYVGDSISDRVDERIGFRWFHFLESGGFCLNGQRLLLHGTHRHEDWEGYGSAVPDELTRKELLLIRAAGFNFIRLGHYPQSAAVLNACDELGIIVWEELPWCRGGLGGKAFQQNARQQFTEMLEQHYNHPSIIFWGLGNELDWESEHPASSEATVLQFLQALHDLSHQLDPQRLTALRRFEPGAAVVDVYSPSIWSGWYAGEYQDYEAVLRAAIDRYPCMLHMEWGADSHAGRFSAGPHIATQVDASSDGAEIPGMALSAAGDARFSRDGDWSESYALDLMEWYLQVQARVPDLAGTAQWVFKDFGTPLRPENPIPYVNQKGLLTRSGVPKSVYYLFQAYLTETPVCHIERFCERSAAELHRIRVYSNCTTVDLTVNGVSQGVKQRDVSAFPAAGLVWWIRLHSGEHAIEAHGTMNRTGQVSHIRDQITLRR